MGLSGCREPGNLLLHKLPRPPTTRPSCRTLIVGRPCHQPSFSGECPVSEGAQPSPVRTTVHPKSPILLSPRAGQGAFYTPPDSSQMKGPLQRPQEGSMGSADGPGCPSEALDMAGAFKAGSEGQGTWESRRRRISCAQARGKGGWEAVDGQTGWACVLEPRTSSCPVLRAMPGPHTSVFYSEV